MYVHICTYTNTLTHAHAHSNTHHRRHTDRRTDTRSKILASCSVLQCVAISVALEHRTTRQHTTTHCNTLPRTATYCNTHTASKIFAVRGQWAYTILQYNAIHCHRLQHTVTHGHTHTGSKILAVKGHWERGSGGKYSTIFTRILQKITFLQKQRKTAQKGENALGKGVLYTRALHTQATSTLAFFSTA